jgi:endonuclease/exonuclease/phosphatase (EEP) superfamily protein YafD
MPNISAAQTTVNRILAGMLRIFPLCIAGVLVGCGKPPQPNTQPHTLTVMTYNVNFGMAAPHEAIAAIRTARPDIVCLQETTPAWCALLDHRLRDLYPHRRFLPRPMASGMAVLATCPLTDVTVLDPPEGGWFAAWALRAQTPAGTVQLLAVHLRPPLGRSGFSIGSYLSTAQIRQREIQHHYPKLPNSLPTIVLGDFNESDSGGALTWLRRREFRNALAEYAPNAQTWRWPLGLLTLRQRLDHILYRRPLHCLSARVLDRGASDHLPVVAVFEVRAETPASE